MDVKVERWMWMWRDGCECGEVGVIMAESTVSSLQLSADPVLSVREGASGRMNRWKLSWVAMDLR